MNTSNANGFDKSCRLRQMIWQVYFEGKPYRYLKTNSLRSSYIPSASFRGNGMDSLDLPRWCE